MLYANMVNTFISYFIVYANIVNSFCSYFMVYANIVNTFISYFMVYANIETLLSVVLWFMKNQQHNRARAQDKVARQALYRQPDKTSRPTQNGCCQHAEGYYEK